MPVLTAPGCYLKPMRGLICRTYKAKAQRNLNFIFAKSGADGSWLYAIATPGEAFIDHFHTCFVLKKLFKINQRLKSAAVDDAIRKGYAYYRKALFRADGLPKAFAVEPRTQIVTLEMYNFAEAITLGALLRDYNPAAFELAQNLASNFMMRNINSRTATFCDARVSWWISAYDVSKRCFVSWQT